MYSEEHEETMEEKALGVTRYLFTLPTVKRTLVYLFVASFVAGICLNMLYSPGSSLADSLVYGGSEGILLIAVPALLSAVLAASALARKKFRAAFKYFAFIAWIGALLAAVGYAVGIILPVVVGIPQWAFVLLANAVVFLLWFVAGTVPLNYGKKAIPAALMHPLLNLAFLVIWKAYGVLEAGSIPLLVLRFLSASFVLLLAFWSLAYLLNAPAKRNFGVNAVQALALFFAQALQGSQDLERVLEGMGETVHTHLGAVVFRRKGGRKPKAMLVVPYVHYGPFGNIGGSELPARISQLLSVKIGCPAIPLHATAFHDFNPVHAKSSEYILKQYERGVERLKEYSKQASFLHSKAGSAEVFGLQAGGNAFLTLSRAPESTEDVEYSAGLALRNLARAQGFGEAVVADRHNCYRPGKMMFYVGSDEFNEYYEAVEKLAPNNKQGVLKVGTAHDPLEGFGTGEGLGGAGLHAIVFETGGRKACLVVFDGNNVVPQFRERLLRALEKYHFAFCDVMTTDTHSVNGLNGVENPLGSHPSSARLIPRAMEAVEHALEDLEEVETGVMMQKIQLPVLGAGRAGELLTTMNAIVSIAKIAAPVILIAALALALVSILYLATVVPLI